MSEVTLQSSTCLRGVNREILPPPLRGEAGSQDGSVIIPTKLRAGRPRKLG